jgi:uncharacterized protein (DUF1684 family)
MSDHSENHASWHAWRARRDAAVTSPEGNLALIETTWYQDGESFDTSIALVGKSATVKATEVVRKDFAGDVIATGYRLWDSNSQAIQDFIGIDAFDFNPEWIVKGSFTPYEGSKPTPFEFIRDNGGTRDLAVPGEIVTNINGEEYRLIAFDDDGQLLLVFGDPTNGSETYGSGRFLFVDRVAGQSEVELDFNRAFAPPCAFSHHYNCPLPPAQNRIKVSIDAGEKRPLFRS